MMSVGAHFRLGSDRDRAMTANDMAFTGVLHEKTLRLSKRAAVPRVCRVSFHRQFCQPCA